MTDKHGWRTDTIFHEPPRAKTGGAEAMLPPTFSSFGESSFPPLNKPVSYLQGSREGGGGPAAAVCDRAPIYRLGGIWRQVFNSLVEGNTFFAKRRPSFVSDPLQEIVGDFPNVSPSMIRVLHAANVHERNAKCLSTKPAT